MRLYGSNSDIKSSNSNIDNRSIGNSNKTNSNKTNSNICDLLLWISLATLYCTSTSSMML